MSIPATKSPVGATLPAKSWAAPKVDPFKLFVTGTAIMALSLAAKGKGPMKHAFKVGAATYVAGMGSYFATTPFNPNTHFKGR